MQDTIKDSIVLSTFSIGGLYMQLISYFFLIIYEYQCKDNPKVLRINRLSCVHEALTYRSPFVHRSLYAPFAVCVCSSITVHKRSPYSVQRVLTIRSERVHSTLRVRSPYAQSVFTYAQSALTVHSPFKRGSRMFQGL